MDLISLAKINKLKSQLVDMKMYKLQSSPIMMVTPPTVTLGVANDPSQITDSIEISSSEYPSTTINPIFTYPMGDIKRADWEGIYHDDYFPKYLFVRNTSISGQFGYDNPMLTIEFEFYGQKFEAKELGTGQKFRMLVDEGQGYQYASETFSSAAPVDGNGYLRLVDFGTAKLRRIQLQYENGRFGGVRIGKNDTVFPSGRVKGKSAIFLGDSYTEGNASGSYFTGYAAYASQLLGWEYWCSGIGGTGYLSNGGGSEKVKFRDRIEHDVIQYQPDYCVIAGGINDGAYTPTEIGVEAGLLYDAIKQGSPKTEIIVLSGWFPRTPDETNLAIRDALKTAAQSKGLPFIDVLGGYTYDKQGHILTNNVGAWITGTGNISSPSNSGNSSVFTSGDTTHPTLPGHIYLGQRLSIEILKILSSYY